MRALLAIFCIAIASAAMAQVQDERPGFFDRLFQSDTVDSDEEQGSFLEQLIEEQLSDSGRQVVVSGFEGALSGRATLDRLTIADDEGVWLTVTDAVLDWDRRALLSGRVDIAEITASEILLPRGPAPTAGAPTPEASGFSLPELPVSIDIEKLAADRILIGEPILGAELEASIAGAIKLEGGEAAAQLEIARLDGRGEFSLNVAYSNTTTNLALDLWVREEAEGVLADLLELPRPSVG